VLEAAKAITDSGGTVEEIVSVIDRLEGARENVENAGFTYSSLFTVRDLGVKT
jgi:orotate phosphoribosyltransferase